MDKPANIILDLREPFAVFRRKVAPIIVGQKIASMEDLLTEVVSHIFDHCEEWDRHVHFMATTANEIVQRRTYKPDFEVRRDIYMAINEMAWDIAAKVERHNLEEYGEFYYSFDRRLPNDAILLSQFWAPGSRADWGGKRHATA